jgi:hypothetical protein
MKSLRLLDEAVGQGSLADSRLAREEDDTRVARAHLRRLAQEPGELIAPADERSFAPSGLIDV